MERKIIDITVGENLEIDTDYYCGTKAFSIIELSKFLITAKDNGATHVTISGSCNDGDT